MAGYNTVGGTTKRKMEMQESYMLVIGFPTVSTTLKEGQHVKLANDGTVSAVSATTDKSIGFVVSAYTGNDAGSVKVATPFVAVVRGQANGTLDEGDEVATSGYDGTNDVAIYKKAVAGDYIVGVVLTGGSTGTVDNRIGLYRNKSGNASSSLAGQAAHVADVTTPDGSDAGTTQTLANALKVKVNAILAALQAAGLMA